MDWHNTKFLSYIPNHFVRVKFEHSEDRLKVLQWLQNNTSGRFAIEPVVTTHRRQQWLVNEQYQIGFEVPADATMYTMFYK